MYPSISNGDYVIYQPFFNKRFSLYIDSIVVARDPLNNKIFIVKRVSSISKLAVELAGDNKDSSIDSRRYGLIDKNLIIGRVQYIIKNKI